MVPVCVISITEVAFRTTEEVTLSALPGYYDVALRDFGLLPAAATLTRLALVYDRRRP
jgi:hypothetical protein